ncbi:MAG: hypothetical protein ABW007_12430 [Chitinophagaceae bacterium]
MKRRYRHTEMAKYIIPALTIRFACAIIYTLVLVYYYGMGDSFNYYQGVLDMHHAVSDDSSVLKEIYSKVQLQPTDKMYNYFYYSPSWSIRYYMLESRTYMVSKFGLPFSLIFNKSFLCISFCISFFAFLGSWKIFKLFTELYPHLVKKIAYATLFLPSILFWGVSLLKDPVCLGAMGFLLYYLHALFIKREKMVSASLYILFSVFLLYNLKPYILFSLLGVFFIWFFLQERQRIQRKDMRRAATGAFVVLSLVAVVFAIRGVAQTEANAQLSAENLVTAIQHQQSVFSKTEVGGGSNFAVDGAPRSRIGLMFYAPLGLVNTYFRPFPWDVRSPLMLFSALEALAFAALTIICFKRVGFGKTFSIIFSNPVITFCFLFSLIFGGIIGITTPNFGALVRYKLPCVSFYVLTFILVMDKSGKFSPSYFFSKRLF